MRNEGLVFLVIVGSAATGWLDGETNDDCSVMGVRSSFTWREGGSWIVALNILCEVVGLTGWIETCCLEAAGW